jgi:hypothetical protein
VIFRSKYFFFLTIDFYQFRAIANNKNVGFFPRGEVSLHAKGKVQAPKTFNL